MMHGAVGNRRRSRRSRSPGSDPTPFWGVDGAKGATETSSPSSHPCSSCRGLSSFCRNCQKDVQESPMSMRDVQGTNSSNIRNPPGALVAAALCAQENNGLVQQRPTGRLFQYERPISPLTTARRTDALIDQALRQADGLGTGMTANIACTPALVRVPPEAKPGDKLLLTRTHHLDRKGGCETTDWECTVADDKGLVCPPAAPSIQLPAMPPEVGQLMLSQPGTIESYMDPELSTAASLMDLKEQSQQQMIECSKNRQKEMELLEQEKLQLQELYVQSKQSHQRLESELQKSRQRCTELECLVRQGVAQTAKAKAVQDENRELRKQLAAYSIEIDVLREDLRVANLPLPNMDKIDSSDKTKENEGMSEEGGAESKNQAVEGDAEYEKKLQELQRLADEEKSKFEEERSRFNEEKSSLQSGFNEEKSSLQAHHRKREEELDELHKQLEARHKELEEGHKKVVESDKMKHEDLKMKHDDLQQKSQLIFELKDCLRQYKEKAETLLENFVHQTNLLKDLTKQVRNHSDGVTGLMTDGREDIARRFKLTSFSAADEMYHHSSKTHRWQECRALKKFCFSHWRGCFRKLPKELSRPYLRYDIAWEMACARQGFMLKKVRHDSTRLEDRLVMLDAELGFLRWGDAKGGLRKHAILKKEELTLPQEEKLAKTYPQAKGLKALLQKRAQEDDHKMYNDFHKSCLESGSLSRFTRGLDLREVTNIDYGVSNRASLVAKERPWKCFSICTKERSYDFVCPEEEVTRCLVLAISRVIYCIKGTGMPESRLSITNHYPPAHSGKVDKYCEKNHVILPGATECVWKCGCAAQQAVCVKGHKMLPGQVSCTTCGNFRKKAPAPRAKKGQANTSSQKHTGEKSNWQPSCLPEWTHWVRGGVQTRGQFIASQGWCKLLYHAAADNTTVSKIFLQAAMRSVFQYGEVIDHSGNKRRQRQRTPGTDPPLPPPPGLPDEGSS